MSNKLIQSLFDCKKWADIELFQVLKELPSCYAEQLHTCIRTLNHIFVVDQIFRAHLSGTPRPFNATNTESTPSIVELFGNLRESDDWYCSYVSKLSEPEFQETVKFEFTDGDSGTMLREEILLHIVTHGVYHRGNVGQVLKTINVAPPRDIFTTFLHVNEPDRRMA